jgi:hypothetical protein
MEYLLKPGVGIGRLRLGDRRSGSAFDTDASRERYARKGVWYIYDETGALCDITVTSRDYATDRQIRVGSSVNDVRAAYGPGKQRKMTLSKGGTAVGTIGEYALEYPGIVFVVNLDRVVAIRLVGSGREGQPER